MQQIFATFQWTKETANKHVYKAVDVHGKHLETVYIHKEAFGSDPVPAQIQITVDTVVDSV